MANRGRGYSQPDWGDPMKEEFDSNHYEPQYEDDNASDYVHLDHCRLYVTNIPKGLNDEGLRTAFAKYGTMTECYLSKDPQKRYGLVKYETAGEAKLAMMKLNRTEPMKLVINLAHKKKPETKKEKGSKEWSARNREESSLNGHRERSSKDDVSHPKDRSSRTDVNQGNRQDRDDSSVKSHGRRKEELANGDNITMDSLPVDIDQDVNLETLDPDLQLELDRLQLEHIKLQQEQLKFKKRMLLKEAERRAGSNSLPQPTRCLLPGGKVVVRNVVDGSVDPSNADSSFTAGAGDCSKIPGLQRSQSRACVVCGARAEEFCSRCGVTPYCAPRCQRRDWAERHKDVCHNLAKLSGNFNADESTLNEPMIPPAAPFRRPRSPPAGNNKEYHNKKDYSRNQKEDSGSEKFHGNEKGHHARNQGEDSGSDKFRGNERGHHSRNQREDSGSDKFRGNERGHHSRNQREDSGSDRFHGNEKGHVKKFVPAGLNPAQSVSPQNRAFNNSRGARAGAGAGARNSGGNRRPPNDSANGDEDWNIKPAKQEDKPNPPSASPNKAQPSPLVQAKRLTSPPVASVDSVTPAKRLVPKNCVIDALTQDAVAVLSVESAGEVGDSWVCVSLHEQFAEQYAALIEALAAACESAPETLNTLKPAIGETFCLFNGEDGGWYRARRLTATTAALLDAGKIAPLADGDKCSKLPAEFEATPEFSCTLIFKEAKIGQNFQCTLTSKTLNGSKVSLVEVDGGATGEGEVQRWRPYADYPPPPRENATVPISPPAAQPAAPAAIPEVRRPDVVNNSRVVLVDMTAFDRAFVRPADAAIKKQFDLVLEDVIEYGRTATPLQHPPHMGQVVVAKFRDGLHYRALVKRTNVRQDKYMLEFVEHGNIEKTCLETLYACPPELDLRHRPTVTSQVTLQVATEHPLTPPAEEFIKSIKETELILTLPSGARSATSGSAAVLAVAKSGQNVNKNLEEMCAPEWKKIEERGGDVIETEVLMFKDLEYADLPADGCCLDVLDISTLQTGHVNVCVKGLPHAAYVLGPLTQKMAEYCNSEIGREPYLPAVEELCIAQCPPYTQWFRAAFLEQVSGAGGQHAQVLYVDYGNMEVVPVALLRKMLPEFVRGLPALATDARIRDFPADPTAAQLAKAIEHMQIDEEGRGTLTVTRCVKDKDPGCSIVEAPALIAALKAA